MSDHDWTSSELGDLATVEMGQAPPSMYVTDRDDVGGKAFLQGNGEFTATHPVPRLFCSRPAKEARTGDALISVRAPVGELNRADRDYVIGRGLAAIRFRSMDSGFGYHRLGLRKADLRRVAQGSTFEAIGSADLKSLEFSVPSKPEQRRIAQILDTLDAQIQRTAQIHDKLQAMFRGMLVDLMIHGTGRTNRERTGGVTDLRLERLPADWSVEPIAQLLGSADPAMRSGPFGSALLKHELVESGVPLLGIDNVHVDRFSAEFERFVSPAKALELDRYRVRPNDVMITIMGTVGRSCLVPENIGSALSSKHVWTLTFDQERYRPYLASLQLNHAPWARAHLRKDEQGGIMSAIRSETLRTLMLPVPPMDEQLQIETAIRSLESKIAVEGRSLQKLRLLKAGLAEDLLTGRVRVPAELVS